MDPDIYASLVDWTRRLARETPFYRDLFEQFGVQRIVDVACGTGEHAALFRSWGMTVEGADINPRMIDLARQRHGESAELRWVVRGYLEPIVSSVPFDAAMCVGNSLALADDYDKIEQAIANMLAAVRAGGVIMVHVLNLWRLADGPCQWQKFVCTETGQGRAVIAKGVHRAGNRGFVDIVRVLVDAAARDSNLQPATESTPFLGLRAAQLETMARRAGAVSVSLFGGYGKQAYEERSSVDLIMVAAK